MKSGSEAVVSRNREMTVSGELARQVRELAFQELPVAVVHEAKRRLIDILGCAVGGYSGNSSQVIQSLVRDLGGPAEATVVGSGLRTSCLNAALTNGVMVRYSEFMDVSLFKSGGHPGEVIPPILAVGERQHSTGKEVITAIVLGYQLLTRFLGAMRNKKFLGLGWTNEIMASYIVPLVAGRLLGLDQEQMERAVGLSGSFAGELLILQDAEEELSMARDLRFPLPAYKGILCTLMIEKGFTGGPSRVFEGRNGFAEVIARGNADLEKLTEWEKDFSILHVGMKTFAAQGGLGAMLQATLNLVKEHDIRPDQVAQVRVTITPHLFEDTANPATHRYPKTKQTADHSSYYTTAVAIIDRAVMLEQFSAEKLQDPKVRELIDKIVINGDPQLEGVRRPAIVEIDVKGGATYKCRADYAKGDPSDPMTDAEIEDKFRRMAAKSMDERQMRKFFATVYDLDKLPDVGELMKTLVFNR